MTPSADSGTTINPFLHFWFTVEGKSLWWFLVTMCLRSNDPFYIVSYYIKWVTTSWTYSMNEYPAAAVSGWQDIRPDNEFDIRQDTLYKEIIGVADPT